MDSIEELRDKYPDYFYKHEQDFYYWAAPTWLPFLELICQNVKNITETNANYIKRKVPAERAFFAKPPKDFVKFQFVQIKMKFQTPRFYHESVCLKWDMLTDEQKELYDEEHYKNNLTDTIRTISNVVSVCETLAASYKLEPL
jgi:hypothetical protein